MNRKSFSTSKHGVGTVIILVLLGLGCIPSNLSSISNSWLTSSHAQMGVPEEGPLPSPIEDVTKASEVFGDQQYFWVPYPTGREQVLATLLSVGDHCYIYMENTCIEAQGESNLVAKCDELSEAFDSIIYPKDIELAGSPDGNLGDIDGDPKVTALLGPFREHLIGGYYDYTNDIPGPYSNYREMFLLDAMWTVDEMICLALHEFNHLIWFNHELDEADFLVEGLANLAVLYAGYWSTMVDRQVLRYTDNPQSSLLYFNRISSDFYWDVSYGQSYLFMVYLYERFGFDFVKSLVSIPQDGAIAIDVALSNGGYDLTFNDVYLDWMVAITLDNPEIYDGIYGFTSVNYTIDCQNSIGSVYPIEKSDIAFNYYGIHARLLYSPLDQMTLKVENTPSGVLGIATAFLDDDGWHVSQNLHTEYAFEITEFIEGINVQEVYFIASLMSDSTPTEFGAIYDLDEVLSVDLDYLISEGIQTETSGMTIFLLLISGVSAITVMVIVIHHRRKGIQFSIQTAMHRGAIVERNPSFSAISNMEE